MSTVDTTHTSVEKSELSESEPEYLTLNDVNFSHNLGNQNSNNQQSPDEDEEASEFDEESTVCYSARSFTTDFKNEIHGALNLNTYDSDLEENIIQSLNVNDDNNNGEATSQTALNAGSSRDNESSYKDTTLTSNINANNSANASTSSTVKFPDYECTKYIPKIGPREFKRTPLPPAITAVTNNTSTDHNISNNILPTNNSNSTTS